MKSTFLIATLLLSAFALAQTSAPKTEPSIKGKFYYTVDDDARIFLNGTEVLSLHRGAGQSNEIELKAGDRMAIQLNNVGGERFLRLLFVAADRSTMLPITRQAFKILPDPEAKDFTEADWPRLPKYAKEVPEKKVENFPFKSRAEYIWGDANVCAIGGVLKRELFVAGPQKAQPAPSVASSRETRGTTVSKVVGTRWSFPAPDKPERDKWIQFLPNGILQIGWSKVGRTWKESAPNRIEVRPFESDQIMFMIEFDSALKQATITEGNAKGQMLQKLDLPPSP
jgi:hypothetical protein